MNVLVTTLISVGAAVVASAITGWFTFFAGAKQAKAARYAGTRQAEALLETVRMQLGQQRAERVTDSRRQAYTDFLSAADAVLTARRSGEGPGDARAALRRAFGAVQLEGPAETAQAAEFLLECLRDGGGRSLDDLEHARQEFIDAARDALVSTA